jgi:hypothetical protein
MMHEIIIKLMCQDLYSDFLILNVHVDEPNLINIKCQNGNNEQASYICVAIDDLKKALDKLTL